MKPIFSWLSCFAALAVTLPAYGQTASPTSAQAPSSRDWWKTWTDTGFLIDLQKHFVSPGQDVPAQVLINGSDTLWKELADYERRIAAPGEPATPTALVRVIVEPVPVPAPPAKNKKTVRARATPNRPLWTATLPVHGGTLPFTIPGKVLPRVGTYRVRIALLSPIPGSVAFPIQRRFGVFGNENVQPPTVLLTVVAPRPDRAHGTVVDSPTLLRAATKIGDPNRAQFPKDNAGDCYARGVKDLSAYQGLIFVGCGDWGANRGPISVWSYQPSQKAEAGQWRNEFTVDEESIDRFRMWQDRLYVPGIDAREDFSFGNVYVRDNARWTKYRTVPKAVHVLDIAPWRNVLYACCGTAENGDQGAVPAGLFQSKDGGKSWTRCGNDSPQLDYAFRFWGAVPIGDRLVVFDNYSKQGIWEWDGKALQQKQVEVFPTANDLHFTTTVEHLENFAGGAIYLRNGHDRPLFYLRDIKRGAVRIDAFDTGPGIADIAVEGNTCYFLLRRRVESEWEGTIYSTTDLKTFTRIALFSVPGPPSAVARLGSTFYVGLGNEGANPSSGTVWHVE